MPATLFDELSKIAFYCLSQLSGQSEPFDPKDPFSLLAAKLREIPRPFLEQAGQLALQLGFKPAWPNERKGKPDIPKGEAEIETFLDLQAIGLELFSIKWDSRDLPDHMPLEDEMRATVDFCEKVFSFARER